MMMLSFLNVAHHVTGDSTYLETAKMLRDRHHYHINAMLSKMYFPPEDVVPWDNNLCLMSMYGLINYEEDPELIMMYRESLENAWLHISKQRWELADQQSVVWVPHRSLQLELVWGPRAVIMQKFL